MAKLKLWVKNLIISVVLAISLVGVGVGLYFVLKPAPEGEKKRELTPEQQEFVSKVSQQEQAEVEHQVFDGFVISDGTTETPVHLDDVVGKYGDYFAIDTGSKVELFKIATSDANTLASLNSNFIVLEKANIGFEYTEICKDNSGNLLVGGDFAVVLKTEGEEKVIVNLVSGEIVLQAVNFDYTNVVVGYVGSVLRRIDYFDNGILIILEQTVTEYVSEEDFTVSSKNVVYNLLSGTEEQVIESAIVYDGGANGYLLDYDITADYVQLVSTTKTLVFAQSGGLLVEELANTATIAENEDDVIFDAGEYGKYSELVYHTVQFVPNSEYVLLTANTVLKEYTNEKGTFDSIILVEILASEEEAYVGIKQTLIDLNDNQAIEEFNFNGNFIPKESNIEGYYKFEIEIERELFHS